MAEYIIAHDVGTSGCKGVLVTPDGHIAAVAYEPYLTYYPRPLWAEQDPQDWWQAVAKVTRKVLESAGAKPQEVLGLAFSTQIINVLPVDSRGQPLSRCISWLDGRAGEEAQSIIRKLGGPRIFAAIVGVVLTGKDVLPKYLWLKQHAPEIYKQTAALVDCSGYLLFKATNRLVAEWSAASVTGLFNLKSKVWDRTLMRFFGLAEEKFPELVQSAERVGGLTKQAAQELGLMDGTPVFGGAGDAMTAAVGSGAMGEGEGNICLGTSGFAEVITSRRVVGKRGIATIQSADPGKLLLISESETTGECLRWAARELYGTEPDSTAYARMDQDVTGVEPGSGNLIFTPWMYGERSPIADERVRSAFINLGANHTRSQMVRSIYEGVAYNFRWMLESIDELYGFHPDPVRVIGGGAKGLPWVQIIADMTGRTLECVANPHQSTAIGAALVAAVGLGIYPNIESTKAIVPVTNVIRPNPTPKATYDDLYQVYKQIYPALRKLYHTLNQPKDLN
jgi:xylulokinase